MRKWTTWIVFVLILSLLTACGDAGNYVKDHYPLVSADGKGSNLSKIYVAEGKTVPVVTSELAEKETPKEKSKESADQMFLLYDNKVINIQKDPKDGNNSLIEVDSVQYAKEHYDSSFLQGFLAASLLQSVMGGGWFNSHRSYDYRGYTQTPSYSSGTNKPTTTDSKDKQPTTSDRTGGFSTGSSSSGSASTTRKNDGSTQNHVTNPSVSKPSTSTRSGSFSRRK